MHNKTYSSLVISLPTCNGLTGLGCQLSCTMHCECWWTCISLGRNWVIYNFLAGPSGKIMLLPEEDPNATHIMIATGTGVAPFRGYLRRMFMESVPTYKFGGLAWLFLGVANSDSLLYDDEFSKYLKDYPNNFRFDRALSREQKNKKGGKMYVQDKIEEYSDEIFKLLDNGAHIYFCGLRGMMPGIQDTLKRVAEQRGESWEEKLSQLKKNKQWHVEVYWDSLVQIAE